MSLKWNKISDEKRQQLIPLLCNLEEKFPGLDNLEFDIFIWMEEDDTYDNHMIDFLEKFVVSKLVKSVIKPQKLKIDLEIRKCRMNNFKKIIDTLVNSPLMENINLILCFIENGIRIKLWKNFLEIWVINIFYEREKVSKDLESIASHIKQIPKSFLILNGFIFPEQFSALEALSVKTFKTIRYQSFIHELSKFQLPVLSELYNLIVNKCDHVDTLKFKDHSDGSVFTKVFIERELERPTPKLKTLHVYGPEYSIKTLAEIVEIVGKNYGNNVFNDVNILICSPEFTIRKEAKESVMLTPHKNRWRDLSWDDSLYRMNICPNPMCPIDAQKDYYDSEEYD